MLLLTTKSLLSCYLVEVNANDILVTLYSHHSHVEILVALE